ncbi:hypothetical protein RM553_14480 [Zunongwangia sp. F363]|uniref:Hydrolase n=1 Tax=Autumnicola tepida TaxID=3075595 RepID=A0ABU3CCJ7_9FLAO|nr:hypothetical protein [Zunongwangia sp. F363]MDT0644041.1 hypothetical protein [Zunongwangia sp. F363]
MRGRILMYLFIFTLLFAIFIYVNDKKILDAQTEEISSLENQLEQVQVELDSVSSNKDSGEYFSLEGNEAAITYLEKHGFSAEEITAAIQDKLISANRSQEDNPYVPYEGMQGEMRINKIEVLNHKWVLTDFTDGTYWGEIFFSYFIEKDGEISLTPEKSFLYPID